MEYEEKCDFCMSQLVIIKYREILKILEENSNVIILKIPIEKDVPNRNSMRSWWNADRADFLITSGVWNMTSIQELFLLGLSFSQAGLWISRTSRKRQVSGDSSGNCKNGEHSRPVNRSLWIVFNGTSDRTGCSSDQ